MQTKTLAPAGRAEQLQFLRFLAFLNVFITHAEAWNFFHYPASHSGAFAVSFFFMLGGLVTGYACYGKTISPTPRAIAGDMWKKLKRIYPLYILSLLIPVIWSPIPGLVAAGDWQEVGSYAVDFGKNLLFLQSWSLKGFRSFNGLSWFLSTMMFLYLWNLPTAWLLNKVNRHKYSILFFGAAFCALWFVTVFYCYVTQELTMSFWHYRFPPARLGEYLSGIILGFSIRAISHWFPENKWMRGGFTVLELFALGFWAWSLRRAGNYWMNHIVAWLIPNAILLTAFTFGRGWVSRLFRWKPLVWLGDISFECYLMHHLIILRYTILNTGETVTVPAQVFSFCFCLGLTIFLAGMLHRKHGKKA